MADTAGFRDYQSRSTVVMERDRALEARRAAVKELRDTVAQLQMESHTREEQIRQEQQRYDHKKLLQDEKVGAKDAQVRAQQERLQHLAAEEERLMAALQESTATIRSGTEELERRQDLEGRLEAARTRLTELKLQLEDRDAKVMRLETKVARQEMSTEKRHTTVGDRLPEQWLPRVVAPEPGTGIDGTAGESVLLVDERQYC